jgi:hypothetical protein
MAIQRVLESTACKRDDVQRDEGSKTFWVTLTKGIAGVE